MIFWIELRINLQQQLWFVGKKIQPYYKKFLMTPLLPIPGPLCLFPPSRSTGPQTEGMNASSPSLACFTAPSWHLMSSPSRLRVCWVFYSACFTTYSSGTKLLNLQLQATLLWRHRMFLHMSQLTELRTFHPYICYREHQDGCRQRQRYWEVLTRTYPCRS